MNKLNKWGFLMLLVLCMFRHNGAKDQSGPSETFGRTIFEIPQHQVFSNRMP